MSHAVFVVSKHWGRALPIRLIAKTERDMMRVCLLGVFVVLLSGCGANNLDAPREFFLKRQIGSGVDFGLFKGDLTDHVASFTVSLTIVRPVRAQPNCSTNLMLAAERIFALL